MIFHITRNILSSQLQQLWGRVRFFSILKIRSKKDNKQVPLLILVAPTSAQFMLLGDGQQHAFSEMRMWTPSCRQKTTRAELLEQSCHGEKKINEELSLLEDRAAAAPPRLTHYHFYFPGQGSRSGDDGDENNTLPL